MLYSSHDNHLKHLLDQRTVRPGRLSPSSQVSDTPSVYSRTFFSPRPAHSGSTSPSTDSPYTSPNTSMPGRRTNFDRPNDPAASMLDLEEDQRSSIASSDYYGEVQEPVRNDDEEPLPRMSLLGPKMRFHSRAPWEMDEDALQEEEEPDYDNFLSPAKRSFGFSSPRPSGESARSQVNSQKSFETTPSQRSYNTGTVYTLPREDLSISEAPHGDVSSLSRMHPESPDPSFPSSPGLFVSDTHSTSHPRFLDMSSSLEHGRTFSSPHPPRSRRRRSSSSSDIHPYANPDLVSHAYDQQHVSNHQGVLRTGDSVATHTDSGAASKVYANHTRVPESISSVTPNNKASAIHRKEISPPIKVLNTSLRSSQDNEGLQSLPSQKNVMNFPGWTDRSTPPTFGLISLEEARAQRSRSITTDSAASRPSTSSYMPSSAIRFPIFRHEHTSDTLDQSEHGQDAVSARVRSISAGSKAKNAFHAIVAGQPGSDKQAHEFGVPGTNGGLPGKVLKHKKSGFMRLFNGARQDKEEKTQPPPVPSLSEVYATFNVQQVEQKVPRTSTHRIPVPELSVTETVGRTVPQYEQTPLVEEAIRSRPSPSPKRPLAIDTLTQNPSSREAISFVEDVSFRTQTVHPSGSSGPFQNKSIPQTAPAHVSEFPALKLRPISTMFSAHFGDHIIRDPRPSLDTDLGTTDSSSNILFPITPNSSARFDLSSSDKPTSDEHTLISAKMTWQRHVWELEGQVRDLKAEIEDLRASSSDGDYCHACGRGRYQDAPAGHRPSGNVQEVKSSSVVHRPRARTGTSSRFASAVS